MDIEIFSAYVHMQMIFVHLLSAMNGFLFSLLSSKQYDAAIIIKVNAIDVSPGGELGVSGGDSGSLQVWETSDGTVRVKYY